MKYNILLPLKVVLMLLIMLTSFACSKKPDNTLTENLGAPFGSLEPPLPVKKRYQADQILEDLRQIEAAIDQYAIESNKPGDSPVVWADVQKYIKSGTRLYSSNNTDVLGNAFIITSVDEVPKVNAKTYSALSDVAPADFWSPFR